LPTWPAALAYARTLDSLYTRRIALWGSSFGGGHVIEAAARVALRYSATAPRGEVKRYPIGHFDIYRGEPFERAVRDQTEFLLRHLRVA
jgi:fermentation-respiration switch protein FrsA (DUF1100 family)